MAFKLAYRLLYLRVASAAQAYRSLPSPRLQVTVVARGTGRTGHEYLFVTVLLTDPELNAGHREV